MDSFKKCTPETARPVLTFKKVLQAPGRFVRWMAQSPKCLVGATLLLIIVLLFVLAPVLATYDPYELETGEPLSKPCIEHLMGCDSYGRDLFSRILYGGRMSLGIGLFTVVISLVIGIGLGLLSGFVGGRVDLIIMRIADIIFSLPVILLALCVAAIVMPGIRVVLIALGTVYSAEVTKLVRGVVLSVREKEFVEAAFVTCESKLSVAVRYVLPNCLAPIIVQASLISSAAILSEAAISYLGLGIQSPTPSLGLMLSDGSKYLLRCPFLSIYPGIAIALTVFSINLMGDGLRDIFDPRFEGKAAKKNK